MNNKRRFHPVFRVCALVTAWAMGISLMTPPPSVFAKSALELPVPGAMVTPSQGFVPPMLRGIKVDTEHPFAFDFILDTGNSTLDPVEVREEASKLIRYFLASLTIPEDDLWVNLSPYEGDRIIPTEFGVTEMGRDVLAQDYILKQLTASMMYPEEELGKKFWDRVYARAQQLYGTTDIAVNTFVKVWIVPDKAVVHEHEDVAFVLESHFKVMLEKDYVAMRHNLAKKSLGTDQLEEIEVQELTKVSSEVIRDVVIPEIEKEVNSGQNFARLRQIYHSLILAKWYKERLKSSILNLAYSDRRMVNGVDLTDKTVKEQIYRQYLEAFKVGVFDYIREEYDVSAQEIIPRKYFSGGLELRVPLEISTDAARLAETNPVGKLSWIQGIYRQPRSSPQSVNDFIRRQFQSKQVRTGEPLLLEDGTQRKTYYVNDLLKTMGQLGHIGFIEKDESGQPISGGLEVVFLDAQYADRESVRNHEALKVGRWVEKRQSLGLSPQQMRGWLKANLTESVLFLQSVDREAADRFPLEEIYSEAEAKGELPSNEEIALTYAEAEDFQDLNLAAGRWGRKDPRTQGMMPNNPVLQATGEGETFDDIILKELAEERGVSVDDLEADFQRTVALIEERLKHSGFVAPEADVSAAKMHEIFDKLIDVYRTKTTQAPGTFQVVDANSVNAFVIRNRSDVYFYKGLFETMAEVAQRLNQPLTEDSVAFIIAHELSHTLQHTSYLGLNVRDLYDKASPYLIQMIKNAEYDADMQALELMDLAGYSVFGAIDAMTFLEFISRTSQPEEVLSSHPYVSLRKNRLSQIIYDQQTTVFTNVKAPRVPMAGTGRLVSRDIDFRMFMDQSEAELLALTEQADSVEVMDEAVGMFVTRRAMNALKSATAQQRIQTAFMRHMFMQAALTAIEAQTTGYGLMVFGDKVDFKSMERAAAIATFGTVSDTKDFLKDEPLRDIEADVKAKLTAISTELSATIAGREQKRPDEERAQNLLRALETAFARAESDLNAQTFADFLLPREEVEQYLPIFKRQRDENRDSLIIEAMNNPRQLLSAFFYANAIGQKPTTEFQVPTTELQVRLQKRSNDLYLDNPRFRGTQSTEDRRALQEIVLTQYLLSRSGVSLTQLSGFSWNKLAGIEPLLDISGEELEKIFSGYFNLLSRDYLPDIAADLAAGRVNAYTGKYADRENFFTAAAEGPDSLPGLAQSLEEARDANMDTGQIDALVEAHPVIRFARQAWLENPGRFKDVNIEQTVAEIKAKGLPRGNEPYKTLERMLTTMQAIYRAQPTRTVAASEIFQRETGLNFRMLGNEVDSFTTLQDLPDWAVADYLAQERYSAQQLISRALTDGTPISEIFDFMFSRLSYADRQTVFTNVFMDKRGATEHTQALLDFFEQDLSNDSREIVLWFLGMFSLKDALDNLVLLSSKALKTKAAEAPDQTVAATLKNMAIDLLEYAYSQTSTSFKPDAASVEVYLELIGEWIDAQGGTPEQRRAAVHSALMKLSPAVDLKLEFSRSRNVAADAPADFRSQDTSLAPEFLNEQTFAKYESNAALHNIGWNASKPGAGAGVFVTEITEMSVEQLRELLNQRLRFLATQTGVEYRDEAFYLNGVDDFFANMVAGILFKKLANPQWESTGTVSERLDELMRIEVSYFISSSDQKIGISGVSAELRFDQNQINAIPFETVAANLVGTAIPSKSLDSIWLNYVKANNLQARFPEFQRLLQNPNVGIDQSNPLGDYLNRTRYGEKVSYRQILKKFFMGSSAFAELFNAYVKEEGSGFVHGKYRSLDERLAWMADVLPNRSIIKDGILDLWEADIFPEILADLPGLLQMAMKANAGGDQDLWTLLGEMDDDVGRLQRLNAEVSVSPQRINQLLDFYTTIIPQVFSPQKIARYGATAYMLWRQLPDNSELGLSGHLEALTKFMPEPSILRDELLMNVASRYIRKLSEAGDVADLLYVNNLLARNRDLRSEDFVSESVQHMFGGAKTADKRDMLLWVVGAQEKPTFVADLEEKYRIDFTSLPDDVRLLPASIRDRFIEGFMLGDNGVLDPRTEEDREVMRDLLTQLYNQVFPQGTEGIGDAERIMLSRIFSVVMETYPAYKRVQVIKALADLGFRTDFQLTSIGERLAVLLGVLGPVGIKVAQFLSENDTLVPDQSLRSSLGSLRHRAPEITKISAISVLRNEIPYSGTLVQEIGDPAGIASIKQVNRGKWLDLERVAGALKFRVSAAEALDITRTMERFDRQEITFAELAGYLITKANAVSFDFSQAVQSVVYKIRRPNMDTTLGSDYMALDAVATELRGESFKGETISSVDELVETVKEWVELEKDFRYEAEFHELLSDLDYTWAETFADEAEVAITHPKVYFATERLIVEEEIQGVPLLSLAEQQNPITMEDVLDAGYTMPAAQQTFNRLQEEDVRRAHIILSLKRSGYPENELEDLADELEAYDYNKLRGLLRQMLLRQIFVDGVFHADLHQGNVIFTPDGRLAMIDRGNVGKLNPRQIDGVKTLLKGLSLRQSDTIKSGIDAIFLGTEHADGRTATFAGITREEIQDILDDGHDLKMTMSLIGARTVQGTARTQAEQDFSKFLKAFTQAIWLFPTDFSNGVGSLEAIAQYVGMTEEEAVSAAEEQAKYFVAQDTTPKARGRDSDLMQVTRRILDEKLAATGNPFTRMVLRAIVFPLIRRSVRSAEGNASAFTGNVIGQVRSLGPRVIRENIDTLVELRDFELLDAVGEMLTVPIAENIMSTYMETSLRGRGFGSRSLGLSLPILRGLMTAGRPVTRVYLDIMKEWLDSGGQKMIAKLAPRMTVGEAIRILAQVFTQDFGEVKKQFDQLVAEKPARQTPAQKQITPAQDVTDIGSALDDTAATAGIVSSAIISPQDVGGIDLNPNLLELQIEGNGLELNIPVNNPNIEQIRIEGLLPVIINVTPITNLPVILGAVETETEQYAAVRD